MLNMFDDVTMPTMPESKGWVKQLRNDRYGQPCALVVWEHHNGIRALIPVRNLERI